MRRHWLGDAFDEWASRPWLDAAMGIGAALAYAAWRLLGGSAVVILDANARGVLYGTLAATAGALLAFGIAPLAVVLALAPGPRLKALLDSHGDEVRATFMAVLWGVLALLSASIAAIGLDTGGGAARWVRYVVLAAAIDAFLATARLVRVFGGLLLNIGRDQASDQTELRVVDRETG